MRYFVTPNYCIALNAKVASTSLCRQMIAAFNPEWERRLRTAAYPPGKGPANLPLHSFVPSTRTPTKPVVLLVREPLDRFLSGVAYLQIDLADAIRSLTTGEKVVCGRKRKNQQIAVNKNIHFKQQSSMPFGETHLFRFPDHIAEAAALIGMTLPPKINVTPRPKPSVTPMQSRAILDYYAKDVALFQSIAAPNTVIVASA
jgi:hypothetical protein